jgi:hypothetical protein
LSASSVHDDICEFIDVFEKSFSYDFDENETNQQVGEIHEEKKIDQSDEFKDESGETGKSF